MIASWIARDPEGAPVAVFATGPGIKGSAEVADIDDLIALAFEGDGVFHVAAHDAVVEVDDDVVVLRRRSPSTAVLTWPASDAWRALAQTRGMAVWLVAETDVEPWRERPIAEVLADERESVLIVAVAER